MRYTFGDFEFDTERFELRRGNQIVETTPQVLSILQFLLVSRSRLVTKDELVDEIWDGRAISDAAITVRIRALRVAIGDTGSKQALLKTVRGKGFRFVGEVRVDASSVAAPQQANPSAQQAADLFHQPSVAVLKGQMVGNTAAYDFLGEAIPDEILTALSRMRSLFVLARGTSFQHNSFQIGPKAVGAAIKAQYVVSNEFEVIGNRLRMSCELAETQNETNIWRDAFTISLNEIHEMREDVVNRIANAIDQNISIHEHRLARLRVPEKLGVWQNFHLGMSNLETTGVPNFDGATHSFERAVAKDPGFARAHAGLSMSNLTRFFWAWNRGMKVHADNGQAAAKRAFELDPLDPICALVASRRCFFIGEHEQAEQYLRQSVSLSPSGFWAQADLARLEVQKGNATEAAHHLDLADALHPGWLNPIYLLETRTLIGLINNDLDLAVETARKLESFGLARVYSTMAALAAYHRSGQKDEAARVAQQIREKFDGIAGYKIVKINSSFSTDLAQIIEDAYAAHGLN